MNTKNNLHYALNKAFENHEESLNEAQWVRLEGAITKKKKRRFFPFLYIFMLVCSTAGITYFVTLNYGLKQNHISIISQPENLNSENNSSLKNNDAQLIAPESSLSLTATQQSFAKPKNTKNFKSELPLIKEGEGITLPNSPEIIMSEKQSDIAPLPENDIALLSKENDLEYPVKDNKFEEPIIPEGPKDLSEMELLKKNDTIYSNINDGKYDVKLPPSRIAFSLAGGYSKMNVKISEMENGNKLHKDTRQLFEQSNQNPKTTFINFGFDLSVFPKLHIGLNTGFQYLRIATPVSINYRLTEVPWRNEDGVISYYIDAIHPIDLNTTTTNYTTYFNIPLRINYGIPLNSKNEILFTGGFNLSTLAAAKGKSVILNTEKNESPEVKPLNRGMYRSVNLGFAGGFQYNTQLKNRWWIGLENIWQSTPMKYKVGFGSIKNKLEGYNLNLLIKYKI